MDSTNDQRPSCARMITVSELIVPRFVWIVSGVGREGCGARSPCHRADVNVYRVTRYGVEALSQRFADNHFPSFEALSHLTAHIGTPGASKSSRRLFDLVTQRRIEGFRRA
jgi:hypothetical protein